jgi:hypothetical protein
MTDNFPKPWRITPMTELEFMAMTLFAQYFKGTRDLLAVTEKALRRFPEGSPKRKLAEEIAQLVHRFVEDSRKRIELN